MDKIYIRTILENCMAANEQWEEFAKQHRDIDDFRREFHLRPTVKGVTIVSTLQEKPMRGINVGKTSVKKWLDMLYGLTIQDISREDKIRELTEIGFEDRKKKSSPKKEESYQARMIAQMQENQSLKDFLEVDNLYFIASEFILHDRQHKSDRERIDIVAYDGKDRLFFFELKIPVSRDEPVGQLKRYIKSYGSQKYSEMLEVLRQYPVNSITQDDVAIEGYAIYGYSGQIDMAQSKKPDDENRVGVIRFNCSQEV